MKLMQIIKEEIVPLSNKQHIILLVIIACVFQFVLFYTPALADEAVKKANINANILKVYATEADNLITTDLIVKDTLMDEEAAKLAAPIVPVASTTTAISASSTKKVVKTSSRTITAYNSEAAQTDNSPCITANGFNLCKHGQEDSIAANWLPFGTQVMIPELFGDRVFVVRDRMNSRFSDRVDVWMLDHGQALKFGVKVATVQVLEK